MRYLPLLLLVVLAACGEPETKYDPETGFDPELENLINEVDAEIAKAEALLADDKTQQLLDELKRQHFLFECTDDCSTKGASQENMGQYGKRTPFNLDVASSDSLYTLEFRFIDECCGHFTGRRQFTADTLHLYYQRRDGEVCECYCEYGYRFEVSTDTTYVVTLNGVVVE